MRVLPALLLIIGFSLFLWAFGVSIARQSKRQRRERALEQGDREQGGRGQSFNRRFVRGDLDHLLASQTTLQGGAGGSRGNKTSVGGRSSLVDPPYWMWGDPDLKDFYEEGPMLKAAKEQNVTIRSISEFFGNKTHGVTPAGAVWSALKIASPKLIYIHGTLDDDECDQLVLRASPKLTRSGVNGGKDYSNVVSNVRTSMGVFFTDKYDQQFEPNVNLRERISSVVGLPTNYAELTQILRYEPGQRYNPHPDTFKKDNYRTLARGGQRIVTALTWLNDCPTGGETSFPMASPKAVSIRPRKGDTIIFYTMLDWENPDPAAIHGGDPPGEGSSKYVAVLWFHPRPFH